MTSAGLLNFAVEWGNSHKHKAEAIGRAARSFIQEDVKMELVYDYMLHLLGEYAKLLKLKATVLRDATELCAESMACTADRLQKKFMMDSIEKSPSPVGPCTMPPPYGLQALHSLFKRRSNAIRQMEKWETEYWKSQPH